MDLITKSAFATECGVSRQAIADAIKRGVLEQVGEGRTAKIDKSCYKSVQYMKSSTSQRKGKAEKFTNRIVTQHKPPKHKLNNKKLENQEKQLTTDLLPSGATQELLELAERLELAKTEKMEQQAISEKLKNAKIRGELISRELVYNQLFLYLDQLHSNMERLADSYLSDIGGRIVLANKVLPEHRTRWKDEIMSQIHDTKLTVAKKIKDIEKDGAK